MECLERTEMKENQRKKMSRQKMFYHISIKRMHILEAFAMAQRNFRRNYSKKL